MVWPVWESGEPRFLPCGVCTRRRRSGEVHFRRPDHVPWRNMPDLQAHPWPTPQGGRADPRPPACGGNWPGACLARGRTGCGNCLQLCHDGWNDHGQDVLLQCGFHALKVVYISTWHFMLRHVGLYRVKHAQHGPLWLIVYTISSPTCVVTCQERITNKVAMDRLLQYMVRRDLCSRGTLLKMDIRGDGQSAGVEARRVLDPRQAAASFSTRTLQYDERPCGD